MFRVNPPRSSDRKRRNPAVFIRHGGGQSGKDTGANRSSVCSSPLVDFAVKCSGQDSPDGSFKGTSGCKRPSAQIRNTSGPLVLQFRIKLSLPAAAPPHYDSLSLKMFVCFLDCTGCFGFLKKNIFNGAETEALDSAPGGSGQRLFHQPNSVQKICVFFLKHEDCSLKTISFLRYY